MAWLLFLDESGHDHKHIPYEIHGGIAVHSSKLWPFIVAVRSLEQALFGAYLHQFASEFKGSKLLAKDRFKWAQQAPMMDEAARRKNALNFLNSSQQKRSPRRDEFTAFGQSSLALAEGVMQLLRSHDAKLFAAAIPKGPRPLGTPADYLRKDLDFLLERYFYFLQHQGETGLLVMDGTEKTADRKLVHRMEKYFTQTMVGRHRTQSIVPVPLFVESDMAYGVQIADVCIYTLNWGWRLGNMTEPTRSEIVPFARMLEPIIWYGEGFRDGQTFKTYGTVFVPDPYTGR